MVFSDLISTILRKQGISANQLGKEIGVTGATISNLATGRVLKPEGKTCQLLLGYCKIHNIDTSDLDWNQIIKEYFNKSRYKKEYEWYADVNAEGMFKLLHRKCGRITSVPIMSLDGVSMPCIHCWTKAYMATDAYNIEEDTNNIDYLITHNRCGYKYLISYEQIKQKKYFCPKCFRGGNDVSDTASYGKRQDYRFLTNPECIGTTPILEGGLLTFEQSMEMFDDDTPLDELSMDDFILSFEKRINKSTSILLESKEVEINHSVAGEERSCQIKEGALDCRKEGETLHEYLHQKEKLENEQLNKQIAIRRIICCLENIFAQKKTAIQKRTILYNSLLADLNAIRLKKEKVEEDKRRKERIELARYAAECRRREQQEKDRRRRELIEKERQEQEIRRNKLIEEIRAQHEDSLCRMRKQFSENYDLINDDLQMLNKQKDELTIRLSQLSFLRFIEKKKLKQEQFELNVKQDHLRESLHELENNFNKQLEQEISSFNKRVELVVELGQLDTDMKNH